MLTLTVHTKPLSVNDAYRGQHFPTAAKAQFETAMRYALPAARVAARPFYRVSYDFHLKNFALIDYDNCIKVFQDCMVKRGIMTYDRLIIDAHIRKFPAAKDRMEINIEGVDLCQEYLR